MFVLCCVVLYCIVPILPPRGISGLTKHVCVVLCPAGTTPETSPTGRLGFRNESEEDAGHAIILCHFRAVQPCLLHGPNAFLLMHCIWNEIHFV